MFLVTSSTLALGLEHELSGLWFCWLIFLLPHGLMHILI